MKGSVTYVRVGLVPVAAPVLLLTALVLAPAAALAAPYAYLVNGCASCDNCRSGTVSVIDTATNKEAATVPVGAWPMSVAANPDGRWIYVANADDNSVSVIDTATNRVAATVPVGTHPGLVVASPDGRQVYVGNYAIIGNDVPLGHGAGTVWVIDTATNSVVATIVVAPGGCGPAAGHGTRGGDGRGQL